MTFRRALTVAALGFAASPLAIAGAHAQTSAENRDADALAADMRLLAANANDVEALIKAGELTLKMGDATAAAGFFGRAEKLDPNNARVKAGWGALLVRAERPGEALRRFQDAEAHGLDPVRFAGDRGLAYDLIGQQDRAQRDYRLVLRNGPDDEVTRRYALSLGISGQKDLALALLEPLLQRSDRAAWRSRAFVLAMAGDASGADRIATTMMAPGMGAALAPFFRRLPELSPTDRAFAVTFGELRAGPERIADARMAPSLPPLGPDPYAPRPAVVAAAAPVVVADTRADRRKKKHRKGEVELAVVTPAPTPAPPALAPPVYAAPSSPGYAPPVAYRPSVAVSQATPSRGQSLPIVKPPIREASPAATLPTRPTPSPVAAAPAPSLPAVTLPTRPTPTPVAVAAASSSPVVMPPARTGVSSVAAGTSTPPAVAAPPVTTPPVVVAAAPVAPVEPPQAGVADQPSAAEGGAPASNAVARVSEDSVLARIVANASSAPASVRALPTTSRRSAAETRAGASAITRAPVEAAVDPRHERAELALGARPLAVVADAATARSGRDRTGRADKGTATADVVAALDKNGCPLPSGKGRSSGKSRTEVSTRAVKPASAAKCKALAAKDKTDAEARDEPARVWVQVAGGANEASLQTAWGIMRDRAPALLRGRQGWTTPLRATNRVLTGPFKSEDEAQDFVNKLTKAGVPAFVFTSAKGQKVEKLTGK